MLQGHPKTDLLKAWFFENAATSSRATSPRTKNAVWRLSLVFVLFLPLLLSCKNDTTAENQKPASLKEALPGIWEAVSFRVLVNSAQNSDSSYVFEVKEENWESQLGIKPVRTYYFSDNKYLQQFRGLDDVPYDTTRGMWNVFGDTLMMIEANATYQYEVTLQKGLSEFYGLLDWDGDGQEDDEFIGIYRLVGRAPK